MIDIHQSAQSRNDYLRKISPLPARLALPGCEIERQIRSGLRQQVRSELKYTTKGKRGIGRTNPEILYRVRRLRQQHTASIARSRWEH